VKGLGPVEIFLMPVGGIRSKALIYYAFAILVESPNITFKTKLLAAGRNAWLLQTLTARQVEML